MEAELRAGLERGEFVAVFQPKVKLETGELVGAEALARWRRPDGSVCLPGVFMPMAEELGLISKLGNCVMRDACFAAAGWNRNGRASASPSTSRRTSSTIRTCFQRSSGAG